MRWEAGTGIAAAFTSHSCSSEQLPEVTVLNCSAALMGGEKYFGLFLQPKRKHSFSTETAKKQTSCILCEKGKGREQEEQPVLAHGIWQSIQGCSGKST